MRNKLCPFCGSDKTKVESKRGRVLLGEQRVSLSVRCNLCKARGPVVGVTMKTGRYNEIELFGDVVYEKWNERY